MSMASYLADQIRVTLAARGLSVRAAERQAGMPQRSIQAVLDGHMPHLDRAAAIADALGLELTIAPVRPGPRPVPDAPSTAAPGADSGAGAGGSTSPAAVPAAPAGVAVERVSDPRLAEVLAVLADTFDALDPAGRELLLAHFWATHPALRERERRLARVLDWLGWRVVSGRGAAAGE